MTEESQTVEAENQEASQDDNQSLLNVNSENINTPDPEDADGAPVMVDPDAPPAEPEAASAERPDYIEEQFWNGEDGQVDLEKLAKSYKELRVKMSAGKHKAPEDGKYSLDEVPEIGEDDEMLGEFLDIAREEGLSQEQVDKILRVYVDTHAQAQADMQEERSKLGRNADRIIESMDGWLTRFGQSGVLSDNELDAVANAATSADFINAMNKIRKSYSEPDIPSVEASMDTQPTTMDEIQSLMADPRYGSDMHYTNQVEQKVYAMHGEKM
tara:strand:- start:984 stop:1793 length:810 start_codon:yes stop_codon:yes gene_type:complete